jgi:hypothetical protein
MSEILTNVNMTPNPTKPVATIGITLGSAFSVVQPYMIRPIGMAVAP